MPKFFVYPFQTHPLVIALILAALATFFSDSRLVKLLCFIIGTKYAYAILINTAQGNLKAPKASFELFNADVGQVFKQYVVFGVLSFLGMSAFNYAGMFGGILFSALSFILLPAMLMLLVATNSVIAALNPLIVVPMVFRIGWRYLLMLLFLMLLPMGPAAFLHFLPYTIPVAVVIFIATFLQHGYTFITYHLMGYVLLQYHDEIGYEVEYEHFLAHSVPDEEKSPQDPALARRHHLDVLIRSGRHEAALNLANDLLKEFQEDIVLSGKYLDLLKICRQHKLYVEHGLTHLQLLVKQKKRNEAIKVYHDLAAAAKETAIPFDSALAVGSWLFDRNEHKKAGTCFLRCIKENPKHPRLPEACFPFIKLLHEQFNNTPKAAQLAKGVLQTWPQHPLTTEVNLYLKSMNQTSDKSVRPTS